MPRLVTLATTLLLAAAPAPPAFGPAVTTRVVPPLADPAFAAGVGRCTSDGVCTVTDEAGTRRATQLAAVP